METYYTFEPWTGAVTRQSSRPDEQRPGIRIVEQEVIGLAGPGIDPDADIFDATPQLPGVAELLKKKIGHVPESVMVKCNPWGPEYVIAELPPL